MLVVLVVVGGACAQERRDKPCSGEVAHEATSRWNAISVLFLFFIFLKLQK